ncbi:MAG: hypothetical protein LC098_05685 [Burkholderiales bacterium]|nr:hypothetical protein [Burkholderiales bacterium]
MVEVPSTAPRAAPATRRGPAAWVGQIILYGLFALTIGVFSHWPPYHHLSGDEALVKLSIVHAGKPVSDCRQRTPEELAKLPPNMRAATNCPRERSPLVVELDIDGKPAARMSAPPSGLSRDGASAVYRRLPVAAGEREFAVRMRDNARSTGFDYTLERRVTLKPAQVLVIDFDPHRGTLTLQ